MNDDPIIFLCDALVGVVLALQITQYWWRRKKDAAMFDWMIGAWILTLSDGVFAARPALPPALGTVLPTILVSVGLGMLFLGAQQTAGIGRSYRTVALVIGIQTTGLVFFLFQTHTTNWRMVFNGIFWALLCCASAWCLRRASRYFWDSITAAASVFLAQGIFHGLRIVLAILFQTQGWDQASAALHFVSNMEVSLFMGALFVALLLAHLQLRHEELASAQIEVQTLSGLLPVCAWCKKVRDDDGYWRELADYFMRQNIRVTHGMCNACAEKLELRGKNPPQP